MKRLLSQNWIFSQSFSVFLIAEVHFKVRKMSHTFWVWENGNLLFLRVELLLIIEGVVVQSSGGLRVG